MKVWRKTLADILSKNHKAIEAKMLERGNSGFADASGPMQRDDYRNEYSKIAGLEGLVQTNDLAVVMNSVWGDKLSEITKALGGAFEGETTEESNDDFFVKTAQWESDLHSIRLDVAEAFTRGTSVFGFSGVQELRISTCQLRPELEFVPPCINDA